MVKKMKQQILVIGGGTTFESYREYLSFLKRARISLDDLRSRSDWKDNLQSDLGKNFDVLQPYMPNKKNAKYIEWKIWFERIIPLLNESVVLVGHSMGGIFLAKYLSENKFPRKIKATLLVAAPFDDVGGLESLGTFKLPRSLTKFANQSERVFLMQSDDDPSVPLNNVKKYQKAIPGSKVLVFNDRGHFRVEHFPELVKIIKSL